MDPFVIRALERMLVILFSGMSIYLGYRLFLQVPFEKDAEGKFKFPKGIEISISRIGPGAFFALFGAFVLGVLVYKNVSYTSAVIEQERVVVKSWSGASSVPKAGLTREQQLNRLRGYMSTLVEVEAKIASDATSNDTLFLSGKIEELRFVLMQLHWGADLGDWEEFQAWSSASGQAPPDLEEAAAIYRQGR